MAGLRAAIDAGGEAGPVHSAGLLVTGDVEWPIVDLRVDWHDDPVSELRWPGRCKGPSRRTT